MISVTEALDHLFALARPMPGEGVALRRAAGRVMIEDVLAARDQPPFAASAMDGYALCGAQVAPGARLRVIGTAAAGQRFAGRVGPGEAVRIFTGAPMPRGADRVLIQEDAEVADRTVTVRGNPDAGPHVRRRGSDFRKGARIAAPLRLGPADIALLAAMNAAEVTCARRPDVALLATGDELVMPGEAPGPDQIIASNGFGLGAMLEQAGARPRLLPIARDDEDALAAALALAKGADLLVTLGGASVGDHDLVGRAFAAAGGDRVFYRVAMRPGKPLMAGRLGPMPVICLPGNPVSTMVCGEVFLRPMIDAMQGLPARPRRREPARLAAPLGRNRAREHYMRASLTAQGVVADSRQDSALLSVLAAADALLVRPPGDPARTAGEMVEIIRLSSGR